MNNEVPTPTPKLVIKDLEFTDGFIMTCEKCHLFLFRLSEHERERLAKEHSCLSSYDNLEVETNVNSIGIVLYRCPLCNGKSRPIFKDVDNFKKHLLFGHCNRFFSVFINPFNLPYKCKINDYCNKVTNSWKETMFHTAIEHGKLYQALKHRKKDALYKEHEHLLAILFPIKHKKHLLKRKLSIDVSEPNVKVMLRKYGPTLRRSERIFKLYGKH